MHDDPDNAHMASYVNASRITTSIRPGVEQFHGAIFGTYKARYNIANNFKCSRSIGDADQSTTMK